MVVTLKVHALDEFDGAKEKLEAGELDPKEGAVHNVDEVWAYFDAEGEGVVATAAKRAKDFGLDEHELGNDVIAGVAAARDAVAAKDAAALDAAAERARGAMNRVFALAVRGGQGRRDGTLGGPRVLMGPDRAALGRRPEDDRARVRRGRRRGCGEDGVRHARRRSGEARLRRAAAGVPGRLNRRRM